MKNSISLGSQVNDPITGLRGTAIARIEYLNGCVRIEVQPKKVISGKPAETTWIDEGQLLGIKRTPAPGGPGSVPPRRSTPNS